jgi:hypothetical protein
MDLIHFPLVFYSALSNVSIIVFTKLTFSYVATGLIGTSVKLLRNQQKKAVAYSKASCLNTIQPYPFFIALSPYRRINRADGFIVGMHIMVKG